MKIFFDGNMEEVLQIIFLSLDPKSLHVSRQVCHQWNNFIKKLWTNRGIRARLVVKFRRSWLTYTPQVTAASMSSWNILSIAVDDKLLVCGMDRGRVIVMDKYTEKTVGLVTTTDNGNVGVVALGDAVIVAGVSDGPASGEVAVNVWSKESLALSVCVTFSSWEMEYWASSFEQLGMKAAAGDMFLCLGESSNVVRVVDVKLDEKWCMVHEPSTKVGLLETSGSWVATTVRSTLKIRFWNLLENREDQSIVVNSEQLGEHQELQNGVIRFMAFDYPTVSILITSNPNSVKGFIIQNWNVSNGTIINSIYSEHTKLYRPKLYNDLLFTIDIRSKKVSIYSPTDGFFKNEVHHMVGKKSTRSKYGEKAKMFSHVDKKCLIITEPSKITFYRFFK